MASDHAWRGRRDVGRWYPARQPPISLSSTQLGCSAVADRVSSASARSNAANEVAFDHQFLTHHSYGLSWSVCSTQVKMYAALHVLSNGLKNRPDSAKEAPCLLLEDLQVGPRRQIRNSMFASKFRLDGRICRRSLCWWWWRYRWFEKAFYVVTRYYKTNI